MSPSPKDISPRHAAATAGGQDFVLVQGLRDTCGTLRRWAEAPGPVLGGWFGGALATAVLLLTGTWVCSLLSTPDITRIYIPGVSGPIEAGDFLGIVGSNLLVLALHATACVAGFIAGSSLPLAASQMSGWRRFIHEQAGPLAIGFVVAVTTFSLIAQSVALGFYGATLGNALDIPTWQLILTVLPMHSSN